MILLSDENWKRFRDCLVFYANQTNYIPSDKAGITEIDADNGERARDVLDIFLSPVPNQSTLEMLDEWNKNLDLVEKIRRGATNYPPFPGIFTERNERHWLEGKSEKECPECKRLEERDKQDV